MTLSVLLSGSTITDWPDESVNEDLACDDIEPLEVLGEVWGPVQENWN